MISLVDPSLPESRRPSIPEAIDHLTLSFFDAPEGSTGPRQEVLVELLAFLRSWAEQHKRFGDRKLLVHCHMGASRSTAISYIALCLYYGQGHEEGAFSALLNITNKPWPNRSLVRVADNLLELEGSLLPPLDAYRRRYLRRGAAYARLNRQRGLYA